jgi:hypothetical protein
MLDAAERQVIPPVMTLPDRKARKTFPQITQIDADTSQNDPVLICVICVICGQTRGGWVDRVSRIENRVSREGWRLWQTGGSR